MDKNKLKKIRKIDILYFLLLFIFLLNLFEVFVPPRLNYTSKKNVIDFKKEENKIVYYCSEDCLEDINKYNFTNIFLAIHPKNRGNFVCLNSKDLNLWEEKCCFKKNI